MHKQGSRQALHFQATLSDIGDDGSFTITFSPTGSGNKNEAISLARQFAANLVAVLPTLNEVFALNDKEKVERILKTYQPVFRVSPEEDAIWAAQQRAGEAIINGATWLTADELGKKVGGSESNPRLKPNRWKKTRKLFAVNWKGVDQYPLYAIGTAQKPLPVVADVLKVLGNMDPWRIAAWFESSNAWLDGKRPRDALSDTDAILRAAKQKGGWSHD